MSFLILLLNVCVLVTSKVMKCELNNDCNDKILTCLDNFCDIYCNYNSCINMELKCLNKCIIKCEDYNSCNNIIYNNNSTKIIYNNINMNHHRKLLNVTDSAQTPTATTENSINVLGIKIKQDTLPFILVIFIILICCGGCVLILSCIIIIRKNNESKGGGFGTANNIEMPGGAGSEGHGFGGQFETNVLNPALQHKEVYQMPNGIRIVNANGNDESKSNQSSAQSRSNNSKSILNRNLNPSQSITSFNDPNSMFNNNKSPSKTRSKSQPTQYQHNNLQINYPNNNNNSRSPSKSQSNSKSFRKKHKNRAKRVGSQSPGLRSQKPNNNGYNFPDNNNMENNNIEVKIDRKQNSLSDDDDSSNNLDQFSQDKGVLSVSDIQNPPDSHESNNISMNKIDLDPIKDGGVDSEEQRKISEIINYKKQQQNNKRKKKKKKKHDVIMEDEEVINIDGNSNNNPNIDRDAVLNQMAKSNKDLYADLPINRMDEDAVLVREVKPKPKKKRKKSKKKKKRKHENEQKQVELEFEIIARPEEGGINAQPELFNNHNFKGINSDDDSNNKNWDVKSVASSHEAFGGRKVREYLKYYDVTDETPGNIGNSIDEMAADDDEMSGSTIGTDEMSGTVSDSDSYVDDTKSIASLDPNPKHNVNIIHRDSILNKVKPIPEDEEESTFSAATDDDRLNNSIALKPKDHYFTPNGGASDVNSNEYTNDANNGNDIDLIDNEICDNPFELNNDDDLYDEPDPYYSFDYSRIKPEIYSKIFEFVTKQDRWVYRIVSKTWKDIIYNNNWIFKPYMNETDILSLKVGDKIDHRDETGKFIKSTIVAKKDNQFKIHYDGWSKQWDRWSNFMHDLHRFAAYKSISKSMSIRCPQGSIYKDCKVDIHPKLRHPGVWRIGKVRRMDEKSGQIEVIYKHGKKKFLMWVHLDDKTEINKFGTFTDKDRVRKGKMFKPKQMTPLNEDLSL